MNESNSYQTNEKTGKEDKMRKRMNVLGLLLAGLVLGLPGVAAALTASNTTISNTATVNYEVGTTAQTPITSVAAEFVVDNKVDITVSNDNGTTVVPSATDQAMPFTLTNSGNTTQRFALTVTTGTDSITGGMGAHTIYLDNNNDGVLDGADTLYVDASTFGDVAVLGTLDLIIVADVSATAVNGETATYNLVAQAVDAGTTTVTTNDSGVADTPGTVQVVWADAAGSDDALEDGKHSAVGTWAVGAADISITKTSTLVSDPINGTTNPKHIPGAIVEYTITVANGAAGATATAIAVTDTPDANTTFKTDGYAGGGMNVTDPDVNAGAAQDLTNASDGDKGDWNVTNGGAVTVSAITLDAGESAIIKFRVTIN